MRYASILTVCAAIFGIGVAMSPMEQFEENNMLTKNPNRLVQTMERVDGHLEINGIMVSLHEDDLTPLVPLFYTTTLYDGSSVFILKHANGTLRHAIMMHPNDRNYIQVVPMDAGNLVSFYMNETDSSRLAELGLGDANDKNSKTISGTQRDVENDFHFSNRKLYRNSNEPPETCTGYTVIRSAIRYDSGMCAENLNDILTTEAYIHFIISIANKYFAAPGLCLKIEPCNMDGYCNGNGGYDVFRDLADKTPRDCGDGIDGSDVSFLRAFAEYMYPEYTKPGRLGEQCDITQLFYGRNTEGKKPHKTNSVGCAFLGAICRPFSATVQYIGHFRGNAALDAIVLAHEVAHSIGALHIDTTPNEFIMEPIVCAECTKFSQNSIDTMNAVLNDTQHDVGNCTSYSDNTPPPTGPRTSSPTNDPDSGGMFLHPMPLALLAIVGGIMTGW